MILGRLRLTARRRQCLSALSEAVAAAGGAVHYSAIAEPLGISPWTAYDLLRELERDGLVAASYHHRAGVAVGRTQVAYAPTASGHAELGRTAAEAAPDDRALRRARARVAALAATAGAAIASPRLAVSGGTGAGPRSQRGLDLAGHLGFWLHCAEQLPGRTRSGLQQLLSSAPEAATALSMFVAAVYGGIAQRGGAETDELAGAVADFQQRLARTTAVRRERLARALASMLDARPPAQFLGDA